MNEILQKRIDEAAEEIALSVFNATSEETEWITDACIESVKQGANFALQSQWISVEEALPPSDDRLKSISIDVMVKNEYGKVTSAWYGYERKEWHLSCGEFAGDDLIDSKITHWMMIPSLKGGE